MRNQLMCGLLAAACASGVVAQAPNPFGRDAARPAGLERGPLPPGADACGSATEIAGLGLFGFDNSAATTDGLEHEACNKDDDAQIWKDVWWGWTSTVNGPVTVSTCGLTTIDTEIVVYAPGAPCPPTDQFLVVCDDQSCSNQTEVSFVAVAGQRYLVRVGVWADTSGGPGQIEISAMQSGPCDIDSNCQPPNQVDGFFSNGTTSEIAESFVAPATGSVTSLCFWGDYDVSGNPNPFPDDFTIVYYTDAGGLPGLPIAVFQQGVNLAVTGPVPTGANVFGVYPEFEYHVSHAAMPVADGATYWVSIVNPLPTEVDPGAVWFWEWSSTGDGMTAGRTPGDAWMALSFARDMALCVGYDFPSCPTDVNGDGQTNFADLNSVVSNFNTQCP